ncbi:hypothetical protein [Salinilacihabitans rarus]|nr:hypothetical protein [Salinilacihabitans rarus]
MTVAEALTRRRGRGDRLAVVALAVTRRDDDPAALAVDVVVPAPGVDD